MPLTLLCELAGIHEESESMNGLIDALAVYGEKTIPFSCFGPCKSLALYVLRRSSTCINDNRGLWL